MTAGNHADAPSAFVIDVGNSFKRTLEFLGGATIDLSPENGTLINPFDLTSGQTQPDPEKIKFLTALFEEILGENGSLAKLDKALLETELLNFYETSRPKTLSGFKEHLLSLKKPEFVRMATLLTLWCKPNPFGLIFDGETNVDLHAPHLHFEMKGCQRYPDLLRAAMLVVMDSIWGQVRKRFPSRSLIVVDEAHTLIRSSSDGKSNSSARWVEDCFRQMRKFASSAIAISQTASDLRNDEIGDGIIANAPNRFVLRQRGDEKTLKECLKLNEREISQVFSLKQLRGDYSEFFLQSETIKGVLLYRPTPLELWLSTTHPPDIALLEKTRESNPGWSLKELMIYLSQTYPNGSEGGKNESVA
jgi:type IV secretory pathway VirB4 component